MMPFVVELPSPIKTKILKISLVFIEIAKWFTYNRNRRFTNQGTARQNQRLRHIPKSKLPNSNRLKRLNQVFIYLMRQMASGSAHLLTKILQIANNLAPIMLIKI